MTEHSSCCDINATANEAARIMWERDCGAVPVLDDMGRVAGIVTDRDLCMAAYFQGLPLSELRLTDIMTRQSCTLSKGGDLIEAEQMMRDHQIRRLVSLADVTRAVTRPSSLPEQPSEFTELCQTVAAVSEPRGAHRG